MKKIPFLALLLLFLYSCGHSQTPSSNKDLTGNLKDDLKILLPNGEVTADIFDGVKQDPRQMELSKRLQASIAKKYEWFVDYMKSVPEGQQMPYHINFGITEKEYAELQGFMENIELISTGREKISIEYNGNLISFKSTNKLASLNSLKIDLENKITLFGDLKIPFGDTLKITSDKNALKSKWKGYSWVLEEPKDFQTNDLKNLENLKARQYKLTIGRLEKNGKTYLSLKGREIENGEQKVNFELPLQF